MKWLITGGCGFIGANLVRSLVHSGEHHVINLDKLGYAANPRSLHDLVGDPHYTFYHVDLADREATNRVVSESDPDAVIHLAAESHVDRSIDAPTPFIESNILGTFHLLEACRAHFERISPQRQASFRLLHVSTDEVFGSLGAEGQFCETSRYQPRSPYAASKASADHLARAWHATYGLPVIVTNSSNNFGPYQFPEKFIPLAIIKGILRQPIPLYGDGQHVRDWLHVNDHISGLLTCLLNGRPGETYLMGGGNERTNEQVLHLICQFLDEFIPREAGCSHRDLIMPVADRPGHDLRYAIDFSQTSNALGWSPKRPLQDALRETVLWYLQHRSWWEPIVSGTYRLQRLGLERSGGAAGSFSPRSGAT